jgi:hypothetical protein
MAAPVPMNAAGNNPILLYRDNGLLSAGDAGIGNWFSTYINGRNLSGLEYPADRYDKTHETFLHDQRSVFRQLGPVVLNLEKRFLGPLNAPDLIPVFATNILIEETSTIIFDQFLLPEETPEDVPAKTFGFTQEKQRWVARRFAMAHKFNVDSLQTAEGQDIFTMFLIRMSNSFTDLIGWMSAAQLVQPSVHDLYYVNRFEDSTMQSRMKVFWQEVKEIFYANKNEHGPMPVFFDYEARMKLRNPEGGAPNYVIFNEKKMLLMKYAIGSLNNYSLAGPPAIGIVDGTGSLPTVNGIKFCPMPVFPESIMEESEGSTMLSSEAQVGGLMWWDPTALLGLESTAMNFRLQAYLEVFSEPSDNLEKISVFEMSMNCFRWDEFGNLDEKAHYGKENDLFTYFQEYDEQNDPARRDLDQYYGGQRPENCWRGCRTIGDMSPSFLTFDLLKKMAQSALVNNGRDTTPEIRSALRDIADPPNVAVRARCVETLTSFRDHLKSIFGGERNLYFNSQNWIVPAAGFDPIIHGEKVKFATFMNRVFDVEPGNFLADTRVRGPNPGVIPRVGRAAGGAVNTGGGRAARAAAAAAPGAAAPGVAAGLHQNAVVTGGKEFDPEIIPRMVQIGKNTFDILDRAGDQAGEDLAEVQASLSTIIRGLNRYRQVGVGESNISDAEFSFIGGILLFLAVIGPAIANHEDRGDMVDTLLQVVKLVQSLATFFQNGLRPGDFEAYGFNPVALTNFGRLYNTKRDLANIDANYNAFLNERYPVVDGVREGQGDMNNDEFELFVRAEFMIHIATEELSTIPPSQLAEMYDAAGSLDGEDPEPEFAAGDLRVGGVPMYFAVRRLTERDAVGRGKRSRFDEEVAEHEAGLFDDYEGDAPANEDTLISKNWQHNYQRFNNIFADKIIKGVVRVILGTPIDMFTFDDMLNNNVMIPMKFVTPRPWETHRTSGAIMTQGGAEMQKCNISFPNTIYGVNAIDGTGVVTSVRRVSSILKNPRRRCKINHLFIDGYVGGAGHRLFTNESYAKFQRDGYQSLDDNRPDILCLAVPITFQVMQPVLSILGRLFPEEKKEHYPTAPYYRARLGLDRYSGEAMTVYQRMNSSIPNFVCLQGTQAQGGKADGSRTNFKESVGHKGRERPGHREIRSSGDDIFRFTEHFI